MYSTQVVEGTEESRWAFKLGLDLRGGSQLTYKADIAKVAPEAVGDSMSALRDVIERRVNLFGVTEPNVQTQTINIGVSGTEHRLIVELPGVTDIDQAIALIGQTPTLEFKTERDVITRDQIVKQIQDLQARQKRGEDISKELATLQDPYYVDTSLTGQYLSGAKVEFNLQTNQPYISLEFNEEGSELFATLTRENVGKTIAIYLDGQPISTPTVNEEITGGKAQITGGFTPEEAKQLAGRLNSGALPIPIELIGTEKVGASLGEGAFDKGARAALYGYAIVALFLILWYRIPGLLASVALAMYSIIVLTLFMLIPVTLTSASIAGFILSIGMAVDANVLIFERLKEESKRMSAQGRSALGGKEEVLNIAFARAWTSIRDSNFSSLITALILFWFGTSLIQGFALTWAIGIIVSMFSAIVITKRLLRALYVRN